MNIDAEAKNTVTNNIIYLNFSNILCIPIFLKGTLKRSTLEKSQRGQIQPQTALPTIVL
jgi:hypothetical protein